MRYDPYKDRKAPNGYVFLHSAEFFRYYLRNYFPPCVSDSCIVLVVTTFLRLITLSTYWVITYHNGLFVSLGRSKLSFYIVYVGGLIIFVST